MAAYDRPPDPMQAVRSNAPRTGFNVPNQGGIPAQPTTPQRLMLADQPSLGAPPGPAGAPGSVLAPAFKQALSRPMIGQPPAQQQPAQPTQGQAPVQGQSPVPQGVTINFGPPPVQSQPIQEQAQPAGVPEVGVSPTVDPGPIRPYRVTRTLDYTPQRQEVESLQPGEGMTTELGDVYRTADGKVKLRLNEMGKQAWVQQKQRMRQSYGKWAGSDDPNAPQPPLMPGMPAFNPFSEQGWIE